MQITKQYRTETAHRLMDYDGKCSHLHGHSYLWEVTAECDDNALTPNGMVMDFKDLKKSMDDLLDPLDHALILQLDDPLLNDGIDAFKKTITATNGAEPRFFAWTNNPTAENMAMWLGVNLQSHMAAGIFIAKVRVWETATSFAEWKG